MRLGNRADANPHTIFLPSTTSDIYSAHIDVIKQVIAPTAVNPEIASSQDGATDVIVISRRYLDYCAVPWEQPDGSGTVAGLTTCNGANEPSGRCGQHEVRLNINSTERRGFDLWLVAHEHGHAIGLRHRNSEIGVMTYANSGSWQFTSHDKNHINTAGW